MITIPGATQATQASSATLTTSFTASATVADVTISGEIGTSLAGTDTVTITLTGDTFTAQPANTVVTWITNAPANVTQTLVSAITAGANTATITIAGTPDAAASVALEITIPDTALTISSTPLTVTLNPTAKWDISS
jgi:hypothetical protein